MTNCGCFWFEYEFECPSDSCEFKTNRIEECSKHLEAHGVFLDEIEALLPIFHEYLVEVITPSLHNEKRKENDKEIRERLLNDKLKLILLLQLKERNDRSSSLPCPFCGLLLTRSELHKHFIINHHGFSIGNPDKIVFLPRFLDTLRRKLDALICISCDKNFRDKQCLKDHMRKKKHYKIGRRNKDLDQFYIVNYTPEGWDPDSVDFDGIEEEIGDDEMLPDESCFCLFDNSPFPNAEETLRHMRESHCFDIENIKTQDPGFGFYDVIKLLNFIRFSSQRLSCYVCERQFGDQKDFLVHVRSCSKNGLPYHVKWKNDEFMLPQLENDPLLYELDMDDNDTLTSS